MNSLTSKQIKSYMAEFCPSSGYVLDLTRAEFEELIDETIDVDISHMSESNGKRLKHLLQTCTDEQVELLVEALRALSA